MITKCKVGEFYIWRSSVLPDIVYSLIYYIPLSKNSNCIYSKPSDNKEHKITGRTLVTPETQQILSTLDITEHNWFHIACCDYINKYYPKIDNPLIITNMSGQLLMWNFNE